MGNIASAKSVAYRSSAASQAFGPAPRRGRFGELRARFDRGVFFLAMVEECSGFGFAGLGPPGSDPRFPNWLTGLV
jgi:hypothetical protein